MSYEYWAKDIVLPENGVDLIKKAITDKSKWRIVRDSGNRFGMVVMRGLTDTYMEEDVSVSIESNQVYVAFHSTDGFDREDLFNRIKNALSSVGVDCRFEEE